MSGRHHKSHGKKGGHGASEPTDGHGDSKGDDDDASAAAPTVAATSALAAAPRLSAHASAGSSASSTGSFGEARNTRGASAPASLLSLGGGETGGDADAGVNAELERTGSWVEGTDELTARGKMVALNTLSLIRSSGRSRSCSVPGPHIDHSPGAARWHSAVSRLKRRSVSSLPTAASHLNRDGGDGDGEEKEGVDDEGDEDDLSIAELRSVGSKHITEVWNDRLERAREVQEAARLVENSNMLICVRIRPLNKREKTSSMASCLSTTHEPSPRGATSPAKHSIKIELQQNRDGEHTFNYDSILGPEDGQAHTYDLTGNLILQRFLKVRGRRAIQGGMGKEGAKGGTQGGGGTVVVCVGLMRGRIR